MKVNKKFIDFLQGIFDYYNLKYKLNARLDIVSYGNTLFRRSSNLIFIALDYPFFISTFPGRVNLLNSSNYILTIASLLHEIKHSIDHASGLLDYELHNTVDNRKYKYQNDYHDNVPFEKRADYFAYNELSNWV